MPRSKTEDKLHEALRRAISRLNESRKSDFKIVREPHVGPFTPDFLFPEIAVIVEVEGPHHFGPEASKRDQERESYFHNNGYETIRVSAEQVSDDANSAASFILQQVRQIQRFKKNAPPLFGTQEANLMLVQFKEGIGFWVEGDQASRWWTLYSSALKENWLGSGLGEKEHASLAWNKYVRGDSTVRAKLDYHSIVPGEAKKFSQRLMGRRVVDATEEGNDVVVIIDTG